jgi:hypothetical protein
MNKNLKKVISAVAALAVSASSIVAFAAKYPDVPETATYAQAVTELSALGVIEGYEDGTFAPDKNVTRAEITKMIVTALGSSSLSAANAATGKDTQFTDVPGSHWASGFVTVGTTSGSQFINGYSDTEFGPEDNVTFAQAVKMLVAALGYTTYAENNGGWPNGYLTYGYNLDIAKGVTGVSNDTQLTRSQVAQMIDNAVKAPICVVDGYDTQWNGTQTPRLVEKNVTSTSVKDSWMCLLNYSHDAYIVNGRVKATHQSESSIDSDKVRISIEKSNNYDGYQVTKNYNGEESIAAYIGESGADNYLLTYSEMIVQMNDDDELTILSIVPAGSNKTATFKTEDFAEDKTNLEATRGTIYAYKSQSSTSTDSYRIDTAKIALGDEGGFYVNGVQVTDSLENCLANYVENNETGTVTLIDSPEVGTSSTDGTYDYIMVTYYKDAVVDSVDVDGEDEVIIYFDDSQDGMSLLTVDKTDDEMYYSFKTADGTDVDPATLEQNTVLSIAYDVNQGFDNSKSYDVLVSTDTVEGKVTSINTGDTAVDNEYTINGEVYKVAGSDISKALETGSEYVLYLDAFGRYAKMEETAASKKIALVDNVYEANGGQYYVSIVTPDGKRTNYTVKDQATYETYLTYCFEDGHTSGNENKKPVEERVYTYSLSSSTGNITLREQETPRSVNGTYKADSNRIGSLRMNDSITSMLDMSEYYDGFKYEGDSYTYDSYVGTINSMTSAGLEDDMDYVAYGFNKISDNSYQFVLVMNATGTYNYNTEFAVFSKTSSMDIDGETRTVITVYQNGDPQDIVLDSDGIGEGDLAEGDPIVVKTDASGYATEILPLFADGALSSYSSFSQKVRANLGGDMSAVLNTANLDKALTHSGSNTDSSWKFGIVADKTPNSITLIDSYDEITGASEGASAHTTNLDEVEELDYASDVKFIKYDYSERSGRQARVSASTSAGTVVVRNIPSGAYIDGTSNGTTYTSDDRVLVDWDSSLLVANEGSQYGMITYALVKIVDDEVTEVYAIVPSTSR